MAYYRARSAEYDEWLSHVKLYYDCKPLETAFDKVGIEAKAQFTDTYFIYTQGRKV
ncbi:MAG: hypothetical protein Q9P01_17750 [Anaerolineae bacterium]|nr:hypothetical protein [Anaerolineae bacterium]